MDAWLADPENRALLVECSDTDVRPLGHDGYRRLEAPLRDGLHVLRADRAGVAGLQALAEGEGRVLAVRLLLLGSGGGLGFPCLGFGPCNIEKALIGQIEDASETLHDYF